MHHLEGVQAPVSAWAPDQVRKNSVKFTDLKAGDVFGIYFPSKQRVAHVGFVDRVKGAYLMTVEANTSPDAVAGSASDRDGQGVYARRRPVYLMKQEKNKFSRYWNN
jgi:ABC-type thiamine transport system ATPase subunit